MTHISTIAMFCEDIREESAGTSTLIGVMSDRVEVPSIPGAFPKLGLYIRSHIDLDLRNEVTDLSYAIRFPDGTEHEISKITKEQVLQEMDAVAGWGGTYAGLISNAIATNLAIPKAGVVRVITTFAGREYICGRMNIRAASAEKAAEK